MDTLDNHRKIWNEKPLIRKIYQDWYKMILSNLSRKEGKTLEIGGGTGNLKEYKKDIISSDIAEKPWLDMAFDAHKIPFKKNSLQNIVMVDVFHHLYNPVAFLKEAYRVLKRHGRIIMIEPFPTFFSRIIYKKFHPEPFVFEVDYFTDRNISKKEPWNSNQAIPYLIFFKEVDKFNEEFSQKFRIIKKQKFSFILYPLSGGFENRQMYPTFIFLPLKIIETCLTPLKNFIAFRCLIVLEKK